MTDTHLRTEWSTVRNEARARWTKLSDSDLDEIAGDPARLVDFVQSRYGYSRPMVEAEVNHFVKDIERRSPVGAD